MARTIQSAQQAKGKQIEQNERKQAQSGKSIPTKKCKKGYK